QKTGRKEKRRPKIIKNGNKTHNFTTYSLSLFNHPCLRKRTLACDERKLLSLCVSSRICLRVCVCATTSRHLNISTIKHTQF
uniref:Uncharacterized protein n=1 Tax=Anopheles quadriannulatus TaxID=34691 RepID=A0A182XRM4_ANOQN